MLWLTEACAPAVVVERVRNKKACVSEARGFQVTIQEPRCWTLLPALAIRSGPYRQALLRVDEWITKN